jgi:hypothetical protein
MFSPSGPPKADDVDDRHLLTICHSDGFGLCIRALRDCESGLVLDHFSGEIGPQISQHSLQVAPGLHIGGTRYIGYLSHGCDPNCRLDMARFELVACRPIGAGEILTIDYAATEDQLFSQFACACGADNCRRWITGRLDPVSAAGQLHLSARDLAVRHIVAASA